MGERTAGVRDGNIGETIEGLARVIHGRRDASPESSYTARLLGGVEDELLKKLAEEASEVIMACKDGFGIPGKTFWGSNQFGYYDGFEGYDYNPERARELLAQVSGR